MTQDNPVHYELLFEDLIDLAQFAIQYGTGTGCSWDEAASLVTSWKATA